MSKSTAKLKIKVVIERDPTFTLGSRSTSGFSIDEKAKHRNKRHTKAYEERIRKQRRQYAIGKMPPVPSSVTTKVLNNGEIQDLPRFGTHQQRIYVLGRDGYQCRYCGRAITMESANLDHVSPFKHGGQTSVDNLVASCQECNKAKGNQHWKPSANIPSRKDGQRSA